MPPTLYYYDSPSGIEVLPHVWLLQNNRVLCNAMVNSVAVSKHEHDGNELQTTPEFRAHVAKKLGAMLDRYLFYIYYMYILI